MAQNDSDKKRDDYRGTGVDTDTMENVTNVGRLAAGFIPGAGVYKAGATAAEAAVAGVQGDVECAKEEKRMADAGIDTESTEAKWNPKIKGHVSKIKDRWKGRMGEAATSGVSGLAGGAAGVGLATTLGIAGGVAVPVIGAPIGTALGMGIGSIAGTYAGNKAFNTVYPLDDKDEVDLTLKIVEAQKRGETIPAEAVFAQWAAQQKGPKGEQLHAELKEKTGLTNFNDALDQGRLAELNAMMNKPANEQAMRASTGMMIDMDNPDRHTADQLAEWINSGQFHSKDLLLGAANMPSMSLAEAERSGYNDVVKAPALDPNIQKGQGVNNGLAV